MNFFSSSSESKTKPRKMDINDRRINDDRNEYLFGTSEYEGERFDPEYFIRNNPDVARDLKININQPLTAKDLKKAEKYHSKYKDFDAVYFLKQNPQVAEELGIPPEMIDSKKLYERDFKPRSTSTLSGKLKSGGEGTLKGGALGGSVGALVGALGGPIGALAGGSIGAPVGALVGGIGGFGSKHGPSAADLAEKYYKKIGQYEGMKANDYQMYDPEEAPVKSYEDRYAEDYDYMKGVDTNYVDSRVGANDKYSGGIQGLVDAHYGTATTPMQLSGAGLSGPVPFVSGSSRWAANNVAGNLGTLNQIAAQNAELQRNLGAAYTPNTLQNEWMKILQGEDEANYRKRMEQGTTTNISNPSGMDQLTGVLALLSQGLSGGADVWQSMQSGGVPPVV